MATLLGSTLAYATQPYESYEEAVASDQPVAQFRFNDVAGSTTIADSVGSYTATNHEVTFSSPGPFNGSRYGFFGGVPKGPYGELPSSPLAGDSEFTIEGWVKWLGNAGGEPILYFGSSSSNYMLLTPFSNTSPARLMFEIHTSEGKGAQVKGSGWLPEAWAYVAVTETSSGTLTLYENGSQVGQTTGAAVSPASLGATADDWLGRSQLSPNTIFVGDMSNVAFYAKALSSERVLAHYDAAEYPVNTSAPSLSGQPKDEQTLTVSNGIWSGITPITFSYQWLRCSSSGGECADIAGATSSSYTIAHEDVRHELEASVIASNSAGSGSASSPKESISPAAPRSTAAPAISGEAIDEHTLSASTGTWAGTPPFTYSYRWILCNEKGESCSGISGATSSTYALTHADVGHTLRVWVTAESYGNRAEERSAASAVIAAAPPKNTAVPTISGTARDGQTLTATPGTWTGTPTITYAYQWASCDALGEGCMDIAGATGSTYTLTHSDVGTKIRVIVTAKNAGGESSAQSEPTAEVAPLAPSNTEAPAISGIAQEGQTLTAANGSWEGTPPFTYAYQWRRCNSAGEACQNIEGATSSSYLVQSADVGSTLRVLVTATNSGGSASTSSASTAVVSAGSKPPKSTAAPTLSGTSEDGQTLTAGAGEWEGAAPLSYAYQWQRCGEGAVGKQGTEPGELQTPLGVAVDQSANLWVADYGNDRVQELSAQGAVIGGFGSKGAGPREFSEPAGIAVDSHGDIWVADTGNDRVMEFTKAGEPIRQFGKQGSGTEDEFREPFGIAVVGGHVWVADTGNDRIQELSEEGKLLARFGGEGSASGKFSFPTGIALQAGHVWVADSGNDRIQEFSEEGGEERQPLAQFGTEGTGSGELRFPFGVAVDGAGHIWVTDEGNERVEEFSESGQYLNEFAGPGGEAGRFEYPTGIAVGPNGDVWVADTGHARLVGLFASCGDIAGATGQTYALEAPDVGSAVRVSVTASNSAGSASATSAVAAVTPPPAPVSTGAPEISGVASEGGLLSASEGKWEGAPPLSYAYQWESCNAEGNECAAIEGPDEASYEPDAGDVGDTVRVTVTASNAGGSASASSKPSAAITTPVTLPLSIAAPSVSGTPQPEETLSADRGTWTGTAPLSYAYQWERCDAHGEECAQIEGATAATYRLGPTYPLGGTLRVLVTASDAAGHASQLSAPSAAVSASGLEPLPAGCTDIWTGPAEGAWQVTEDWSKDALPGPEDMACLRRGTSVKISEGANQVAALYDAGSLALAGGSLALQSATAPSNVASLTLQGATLTGAGNLTLGASLIWSAGTLSGSGRTVLGPLASGTIEATDACEAMQLTERPLINEGALTFGSGTLYMSSGARLENEGSFAQDSEDTCLGSQIALAPEAAGAAPAIANTGTYEKSAGTGTSAAAVSFTNDGAVKARSGTLEFKDGGGGPEDAATGEWSTEGSAVLALGAGTFYVGESVNLASVTVREGATVIRVGAPANTGSPSITGTAAEGQSLEALPGTWSGAELTYAYQWRRCNSAGEACVSIAGATSASYTLTAADVGDTLRVLVTATNRYGAAIASSPASAVVPPRAPSSTSPPEVQGEAEDGQVLSAAAGTWSGTPPFSYGYQWESCNEQGNECAPVEGASASQYELGDGDVGSTLRVVVIAKNAAGEAHATSAASQVIRAEAPSELEAPTLEGTPDVHDVLYADPGLWSGTETVLSYQWESCNEHGGECAPVQGATGSQYDLGEGDLGTTLRVRIGAHSRLESLTDVSPASAVIGAAGSLAGASAPSISGSAQVGQALSAGPGTWSQAGSLSYSYQWQRCDILMQSCEDISEATASTYVPAAADAGHRLRVLVTASDQEGHKATQASQATQTVASEHAPLAERAPLISGASIKGQTLSAGSGVFAGQAAISYSYQWERCAQGGSCAPLEGATQRSYTPAEADVGSALLVEVSANGGGEATTAASARSAAIDPEALAEYSAPSISEETEAAGTLQADPGIWSGAGPVSYEYQWESCNSAGEACAPIEGATEQTYVTGEGDVGSALRVKVTVKGPLGSKTALSAATPIGPAGEVSAAEAQRAAEGIDPALFAPSATATIEGQSIAPSLLDSAEREELQAQNALTSSTISKETPGELAVNSPPGELSLTPVQTLANALSAPTLVNGAAALFANTWPSTDTIVRPSPLGESTFLDLRSAQAPRTFSWEMQLGPEQELQQLPDGAVAVVPAAEVPPQPGEGAQEGEGPEVPTHTSHVSAAPTPEELTASEQEKAEAPSEAEELEEAKLEEEGKEGKYSLEALPAAPTSQAPGGEAPAGQPAPQQTQGAYEAAKAQMSYAEEKTAGNALMVIAAPTATDAEGSAVPASLATTGERITLTVKPPAGAAYPLLVKLPVAAPTDKVSAERDPVIWGIQDSGEPHLLPREHFTRNAGKAKGFDRQLFNGAPGPPKDRKVRSMRLIVAWDALIGPNANAQREALKSFLHSLKSNEAHLKRNLEPYITFGRDYSKYGQEREGCEDFSTTEPEKHCRAPLPKEYQAGVEAIMEQAAKWHRQGKAPQVKWWGAWNEPNATPALHSRYATNGRAGRAAEYWFVAERALANVRGKYPCPRCKIVAGEFATWSSSYVNCYRNVIITLYCNPKSKPPTGKHSRHGFGKKHLPKFWGFHAYNDVDGTGESKHTPFFEAHRFAKFANRRLAKVELLMTEAGVDLSGSNIKSWMHLMWKEEAGTTPSTTQRDDAYERQQEAANRFLQLPEQALSAGHAITRMYYYMYSGVSEQEFTGERGNEIAKCLEEAKRKDEGKQKEEECEHLRGYVFDAALFEGSDSLLGGKEGEPRPAYCVLAYKSHRCPPSVAVEPRHRIGCAIEPAMLTLNGTVNPHGVKTTIYFEYEGERKPVSDESGLVSVPVQTKVPRPSCSGGGGTRQYRLVARNQSGTVSAEGTFEVALLT